MRSIVEHIKTENFARIRVGIGKPQGHMDMISHVIGHIPEEELKSLDEGVTIAKDATIEIIKNGIDSAMNKFNKKALGNNKQENK